MSQTYKAHDIFMLGCGFENGANELWDSIRYSLPKNPTKKDEAAYFVRTLPCMTMQALAAELYLKSLIMSEEKSFDKIHSLYKLFVTLNEDTKKRIREHFDLLLAEDKTNPDFASFLEAPGIPIDFHTCLETVSNNFIDSRYAFENNLKRERHHLTGYIAWAIRKTILEIHGFYIHLEFVIPKDALRSPIFE